MSNEELWSYICGLREDLGHAESRIQELEEKLDAHVNAVPHAVTSDV